MRRALSVVGIAAAVILTASAPAFAQQSSNPANGTPPGGVEGAGGLMDKTPQERNQALSVWAFLPYTYGIGIGAGARYTIPVVKNGFIPGINNSVELEFGGDLAFGSFAFSSYGYTELIIPAEGRWTFHFTPAFSAYWKLGLGYDLILTNLPVGVSGYYAGGFYVDSSLGLIYKLGDKFGLRAEFGYRGLRAGVSIEF